MKTITYRIAGRAAALEVDRLYRRVIDGRLVVRIDNGSLRDASSEEAAAVAAQLGGMTATPNGVMPDFAAMSKLDLEAWAKAHYGVALDRRRRKETLIEEVRALEAGCGRRSARYCGAT